MLLLCKAHEKSLFGRAAWKPFVILMQSPIFIQSKWKLFKQLDYIIIRDCFDFLKNRVTFKYAL